MKYTVGLLGLLLTSANVWAAPETMTMYATLAAPVASFWEVQTKGCEAVEIPEGKDLNLGFVSGSEKGGNIKLKGKHPLAIGTLHMEKDTKLEVGNSAKWIVEEELVIGKGSTVTLDGAAIVKYLEIKSTDSFTVQIDGALRLGGSNRNIPEANFTKMFVGNCDESDSFCFKNLRSPGNNSQQPTGNATWEGNGLHIR